VVLLPLGGSAGKPKNDETRAVVREPLPKLALCVGCALLLVVSVQGLRGQTQAWPFACYPTFASVAGNSLVDLRFEVRHPDGRVQIFTGREQRARTQLEWGRAFYLASGTGSGVNAPALTDFARRMAKASGVLLEPGAWLSVDRVEYATAPETWGSAPVRATRLLELTLNR
jgi:hypothetical protein